MEGANEGTGQGSDGTECQGDINLYYPNQRQSDFNEILSQLTYNDKLAFGEVRFYFIAEINGEDQALALLSVYSTPDPTLLADSYNTLWACTHGGDEGLRVVNVKCIESVVGMVPLWGYTRPDGKETVYVVEKFGLDIANMAGETENILDE